MTQEKYGQLHKEADRLLTPHYAVWEKYCGEELPFEYRYFAADIIFENIDAEKYKEGDVLNIACACQCFLLSRIAHFLSKTVTAAKTLTGDYFASLVPQFKTEAKTKEGILSELFSKFTAEEISQMLGKETEDKESFRQRYEELFLKTAEVLNE